MTDKHLIYVADPMCSWCWGFSPAIEALRARHPDLPIRLMVGGLRPGNTAPMAEPDKAEIRSHWEHVHEASGQPFDFGFFAREGFVYDTAPACKAVVVARRAGPEQALDYLREVHRAFYAENRDVTQVDELAALAARLGHDEAAFREAFADPALDEETWTDFAVAQKSGIRGFPTLLAGAGAGAPYAVVTYGYQPPERIEGMVAAFLAGEAGPG